MASVEQAQIGFCATVAKCTVCTHVWAAVFPEGTEQLECPNCGRMQDVDEAVRFDCITKTRIRCMTCGQEAHGDEETIAFMRKHLVTCEETEDP